MMSLTLSVPTGNRKPELTNTISTEVRTSPGTLNLSVDSLLWVEAEAILAWERLLGILHPVDILHPVHILHPVDILHLVGILLLLEDILHLAATLHNSHSNNKGVSSSSLVR